MSNLVKKVQNTSFKYGLFKKGDKIILAVSGGPDSAAMLDIFSKLQKKYDWELIIAHVNYGLRKNDSELDEKFVRDLAKKYNLKIFVKNKRLSKKNISENYLRDIRYDFFENLRSENKFNSIAVAHNLNDQVETFFMRLIRGAGLQGLSGMQFKNGNIIRPMLEIKRDEILEYLEQNKLKFQTDKTNLETKFLRNKIRNRLIPLLEKDYNPRLKNTVFSEIESIAEDCDFLNKETEKAYKNLESLSVENILKLHPSVQKRLLRRAIFSAKKNLKNIKAAHMAEVIKILKSKKGKAQCVIFQGLKITRRGDKLHITRNT